MASKNGSVGLIGRRVGAFFAGLVVCVVLSNGTDALMHAAGIYPAMGVPMAGSLFAVAASYRCIANVISTYLAARLAPDHRMGHALALGIFGTVVGLAATLATWNKGPAFGPHWYGLVVAASSLPSTWLGGKLAVRRSARSNVKSAALAA